MVFKSKAPTSTKSKMLSIEKAKYVSDYTLKIFFTDGKEINVDFEDFLKKSSHPEIRKYLDKGIFKNFSLEKGELMWGDFDLIFPIEDLYSGTVSKSK